MEEVAETGYGKTRKQVQLMVETVAKEKSLLDDSKRISDRWWRRLKQRQSKMSLRKGDSTAAVRLACTTGETMKNYFDLLGNVLKENKLLDKPAQVYNTDETGMPIDHRPPNVVDRKGKKKV